MLQKKYIISFMRIKKINNLPNILTIIRLLSCPLIICLFIFGKRTAYENVHTDTFLQILTIFMLACLTDFFDGYLARKKSLKSNFGKILDPIADKSLIITVCIMLLIYEKIPEIHKIAFYILIIREIIVSSLRFNLVNVNKNINVSQLSKYKNLMQMLAFGSILIYKSINHSDVRIIVENISYFLIWFAAFATFVSGVQHFKTYLKLK